MNPQPSSKTSSTSDPKKGSSSQPSTQTDSAQSRSGTSHQLQTGASNPDNSASSHPTNQNNQSESKQPTIIIGILMILALIIVGGYSYLQLRLGSFKLDMLGTQIKLLKTEKEMNDFFEENQRSPQETSQNQNSDRSETDVNDGSNQQELEQDAGNNGQNSNKQNITDQATANQEPTNPDTVFYQDGELGINFHYSQTQGSQSVATTKRDSTVYIYFDDSDPESGQFIRLFSKDPDQTLAEAIKTKFLQGKDEDLCWVDVDPSPNQYPTDYMTAEIVFLNLEPLDLAALWEQTQYCSADYAHTNGIRYFLYDIAHPDRFAFISVGQYAITAGEQQGWQETVRFE